MISRIAIIDGDPLKVLEMVSGSCNSNFELSSDRRELYFIDTYYSRGSRGTRTDVVPIYEARKLEPLDEVSIARLGATTTLIFSKQKWRCRAACSSPGFLNKVFDYMT